MNCFAALILTVVVAVGFPSAFAQEKDLLDLTQFVPAKPEKSELTGRVGGVGGGVSHGDIPRPRFEVRLLHLDRKEYSFKDQLIFEFSLTNTGTGDLVIPWTADKGAIPTEKFVEGTAPLEAIIWVTASNGEGKKESPHIHSHRLYGANEVAGTTRKLRLGETIRVRAPAKWDGLYYSEVGRSFLRRLPLTLEVSVEFMLRKGLRFEGTFKSKNKIPVVLTP